MIQFMQFIVLIRQKAFIPFHTDAQRLSYWRTLLQQHNLRRIWNVLSTILNFVVVVSSQINVNGAQTVMYALCRLQILVILNPTNYSLARTVIYVWIREFWKFSLAWTLIQTASVVLWSW